MVISVPQVILSDCDETIGGWGTVDLVQADKDTLSDGEDPMAATAANPTMKDNDECFMNIYVSEEYGASLCLLRL